MTGKCPPVLPVWSLRCSQSIMIDTLYWLLPCVIDTSQLAESVHPSSEHIVSFPASMLYLPGVFFPPLSTVRSLCLKTKVKHSFFHEPFLTKPKEIYSLYSERVTVYNNIISTHSLVLAHIPLGLCPVIGLHCYFLGDCLTFYRFALSPQLTHEGRDHAEDWALSTCCFDEEGSVGTVSQEFEILLFVTFSRTWKVLTEGMLAARVTSAR